MLSERRILEIQGIVGVELISEAIRIMRLNLQLQKVRLLFSSSLEESKLMAVITIDPSFLDTFHCSSLFLSIPEYLTLLNQGLYQVLDLPGSGPLYHWPCLYICCYYTQIIRVYKMEVHNCDFPLFLCLCLFINPQLLLPFSPQNWKLCTWMLLQVLSC